MLTSLKKLMLLGMIELQNIKKLLNLAFRANTCNMYGFNHDIMIAYYLINTLDSNHSIENITYNVLDINFPEIKDEPKKAVQTSIKYFRS